MPIPVKLPSHVAVALIATGLFLAASLVAGGQSQEPKPGNLATPVPPIDAPTAGTPASGVIDSSWESPNWGVRIAWNPAIWTVEQELIDPGYEGLQLGTPASTFYVEAYNAFAGDSAACLDAAAGEIGEREGVSEVVPLSGRPLPGSTDATGSRQLFGLVARLPDGGPYRGAEYVECRTLVAGEAVLEITWQTSSASYNAELPLVDELLATLATGPESAEPPLLPSSPPEAEPAIAHYWPSLPERASAK